MTIKTLCVFGTRPEAIKMAPVVKALNASPLITNRVCVTGQHQQMLHIVLQLFQIIADFDLEVMTHNQSLSELSTSIFRGLGDVFKQYHPDLILVHGDTTTCFIASLSAYYHHIQIAHVESGLRTGNIYLPWPEEINRKLTDAISSLHFAPTEESRLNLLKENIPSDSIYVTGNTVIDALFHCVEKLECDVNLCQQLAEQFYFLDAKRKIILVTGHRRESFGEAFERICRALLLIAQAHPNIDIVYPVHLNPNVQEPVNRILDHVKNVYLIAPVDYFSFVYLMKRSYFILTDSGGIQEEASSLGKPVLVMRNETERTEALLMGTVKLVGTDVDVIVNYVEKLLIDESFYESMSCVKNLYGDGKASFRITEIIIERYLKNIKKTTKQSKLREVT